MFTTLRFKRRHASPIVAALIVSLIVPAPPVASADTAPRNDTRAQQDYRDGHDRPPSTREPDSDSPPWAAVGLIAVLIALNMKPHERATDKSLSTSGPRLPDVYSLGSFPVQGYTRGGWPMVVDFKPEWNTRTWVEVAVDGRLAYSELLDQDGRRGRQLVKITLPAGIGNKARPGLYVIRSAYLAGGQELKKDARGQDVPAPLEIYGIGAGPRAIGSVAIEDVVFEPERLRLSAGNQKLASYSYKAKSNFNRAVVEILKFDNLNGEIHVKRVKSEGLTGVDQGTRQSGTWNGIADAAKGPSFGLHRLQVRAWFNSEDDLSWVGAWSPGAVNVAP